MSVPPEIRDAMVGDANRSTATSPESWGDSSNFFGRLFDVSFHTFITPSIVSIVFVLFIIVDAIASLAVLFVPDRPEPLVRLFIAVLFFFGALIWFRVSLEAIMVLHRIEQNTRLRR